MIVYGARASRIGNFYLDNTSCEYCKETGKQEVSVFGRYVHIFWIPIFPIGKKAVSECVHCKRTIEQKDFTPELKSNYTSNLSQAKRPVWHFSGLILIGAFILFSTIIGMTAEVDPREELLQEDVKSMTFSPTYESDSLAAQLKMMIDIGLTDELDHNEFKYFTKVEEDKALILIQIPDLKKVEKSSRPQIYEVIEPLLESKKNLEGKDLYIGIHGKYNFMMTKSPQGQENSSIAGGDKLYEFYGPEEIES